MVENFENDLSSDCEDQRLIEIHTLKNIYLDNFHELTPYEYFSPYAFSIDVEHFLNDLNRSVRVEFYLAVTYPNRPPNITLKNPLNISLIKNKLLQSKLNKIAKRNVGQPMIHNLILEAQEMLENIGNEEYEISEEENSENNERNKQLLYDINKEMHEKEKRLRASSFDDTNAFFDNILTYCSLSRNSEKDFEDKQSSSGSENNNDKNIQFRRKNSEYKSRYENDFEQISILGKGGYGVIYKAKNRLDGLYYAVKQIIIHQKSKTVLGKVLREVKAIARLQHTNVVRYYQAWIEEIPADSEFFNTEENSSNEILEDLDLLGDDYDSWQESENDSEIDSDNDKTKAVLFIQMEFCEGKTLKDLINSETPLSKELIWRMFLQIFEAIDFIHSQKMIHRDIKPTNIFLDSENNIKLGDFGLAIRKKIFPTESTKQNRDLAGTPFYCSPEQENKSAVLTEKVDVYPIGIILLEMGRPFKTEMERIEKMKEIKKSEILDIDLKQKIDKKLNYKMKEKNYSFSAIIESLLKKDPKKRPGSIDDLINEKLVPLDLVDSAFKVALKELENKSSFRNKAVKKLFSVLPPKHMSFTYDSLSGNRTIIPHNNFGMFFQWDIKTKLSEKIVDVFNSFGLRNFETPLLSICSKKLKSQMNLLDTEGNVLCLPHESFLPMAQYAAANEIEDLSRYCMARVYKETLSGSQPIHIFEAHFDFIKPKNKKIIENSFVANAISVAIAAIKATIKYSNRFVEFRLSDTRLLKAILNLFLKKNKINSDCFVKNILSFLTKTTFATHSKFLNFLTREQNFDLKTAKQICNLVIKRGNFKIVEKELISQFKNSIDDVLFDIRQVFEFLQILTNETILFDLSLVDIKGLFEGPIFAATTLKQKELLSFGGEYSHLIQKFSPPKKICSFDFPFAFGASIYIEKLINIIRTDKNFNKKKLFKRFSKNNQILLFSQNDDFLKERIVLCKELRKFGISATYQIPQKTNQKTPLNIRGIISACSKNGVKWLIDFKKNEFSNGILKVYKIEPKLEMNLIKQKDITKWLRNSLNLKNSKICNFEAENAKNSKNLDDFAKNCRFLGSFGGKLKENAKKKFIFEACCIIQKTIKLPPNATIIIAEMDIISIRNVVTELILKKQNSLKEFSNESNFDHKNGQKSQKDQKSNLAKMIQNEQMFGLKMIVVFSVIDLVFDVVNVL